MNNIKLLKFIDKHPRGQQTVPERLAKEYNLIDTEIIQDSDNYNIISFIERMNLLNKVFPLRLRKQDDIFFSKYEKFNPIKGIKASTSFNYWRDSQSKDPIDIFLPIRSDFKKINNIMKIDKEKDIIKIGIYNRPNITPKFYNSFYQLIDFIIKNQKQFNLKLFIMGEYPDDNLLEALSKINWEHHFCNVKFFKEVTHYIYSPPEFNETFCNNLYEAVQMNCQIVMFNYKYNPGVDEVLEHINFFKIQNYNELISSFYEENYKLNDFENSLIHPKNFQKIKDSLIYDYQKTVNQLKESSPTNIYEYIKTIN